MLSPKMEQIMDLLKNLGTQIRSKTWELLQLNYWVSAVRTQMRFNEHRSLLTLQ